MWITLQRSEPRIALISNADSILKSRDFKPNTNAKMPSFAL